MKNKKPSFKFKKLKPSTGLASVGHPYPDTLILFDKMAVGYITAPCWSTRDHCWGVALMVEVPSSENCSWSWRDVEERFSTEPEARTYLQQHIEELLTWTFHQEPREDFEC